MNPEELRRQLENGSITEAEYLDRVSNLQRGYYQDMFTSTGQRSDSPTGYERQSGYREIQTPLGRTYIPSELLSNRVQSPYPTGQRSDSLIGEVDSRGRILTDGYGEYQPRLIDRMRGNRNDRRFGTGTSMEKGQFDSQEDYIERMQEAQAGSPDKKTYEQLAKEYDNLSEQPNAFLGPRYLNPWGGDMNTNAYLTGRAFGAEKGSRGRGLGIASGIGNLSLGLARTIGSGYANSKMYDETMDTYRRNRAMDRQYTTTPSYYDTNNTGGSMKYGGEKKYKSGGETDMTPMDRYNRIMHSQSYMKNGGRKMYKNGGEMPNQSSELDLLMQMKGMNSIDFESEDKNKLYQEDEQMKRMMEEGGEVEQEPQQQQEAQPEIDPKLVEIAQDMTEDFATVEEAQAYLEQEGVSPQMIEQVLQLFMMIKQEKEGSQQRQPPSSSVMNDNMSSGMSMEFRYGGRSKYPKL